MQQAVPSLANAYCDDASAGHGPFMICTYRSGPGGLRPEDAANIKRLPTYVRPDGEQTRRDVAENLSETMS